MHHIQISDQLYQDVLRQATANGFADVDGFVTDILEQTVAEPENFGHFFTPERLAEIAEAVAQVDAGQTVSSEEVREHFRNKFKS